MDTDLCIPELDELIDGVKRKIDIIKEYGPPESTEILMEIAEHALRRISEYIARCNIFGYTDMVFNTGIISGDLGEIAETIRIGAETGFFNERYRPCKKCSSKETTEEYADLLTDLALTIKTIITISSDYLKDNCCPIEEEELLKYV
jgi:phosphosulfolactate synthase (CoM biosynthesis protein A)